MTSLVATISALARTPHTYYNIVNQIFLWCSKLAREVVDRDRIGKLSLIEENISHFQKK